MSGPDAPSQSELRAALYYAVGVTSEGSRDSFRLAFAGNRNGGLLQAAENSGYSVGTLQTDLGQRPQTASALMAATLAWAESRTPPVPLPSAAVWDAGALDIARNGGTIRADGGRDVDPTVLAPVRAFLGSPEGVTWVHRQDSAQVDKLISNVVTPLQATAAYQAMSPDDRLATAVMVGKLYNQSEVSGTRVLNAIAAGELTTLAQIDARIDRFGGYREQGNNHVTQGIAPIAALRAAPAGTAFAAVWADLQANPIREPVLAERGLTATGIDRSHQIARELALDYDRAPAVLDAADRGAQLSRGRAPSGGSGAMVSGDTVAIWGAAGPVHLFRDGQWESHDRAQVQRVGEAPNHELQLTRDGRTETLLRVDPTVPALRMSAAERAEVDRRNEGRLTDREVQQALRDGGFTDDRGRAIAADGDFGARSRQALAKFEAAEGLPVDGQLDPQARLRLAVRHADQVARNPPPLPEGQQRGIAELGHPQHARYLEARAALAPHHDALGLDNAQARQAAAALATAAVAAGHTRIGDVRVGADGRGVVMAPAPGAPEGTRELPLSRDALLPGATVVPVPVQRRTEAPAELSPSAPSPTRIAAASRDPLFDAALAGVQRMDREMGRTPDAASERVAAALAAEWRAQGARGSIDGVVLGQQGTRAGAGEYVFAYSGSPERPTDFVGVRTAEAVRTPVEQSLARAEQIERQQGIEAQRAAQQAQDTPAMRMG
jgi:peptidoglycan hydrolase-like protein with peptidoglycan-binding domain